ncbi:MAG: phosphoglycerate kinase [Patescibacteria group bacterium]
MLRSLTEALDLKGKHVLVRAALNVPVEGTNVVDATRLFDELPTISLLRELGARIMLVSHHSKGSDMSLAPVHAFLTAHVPLSFIPDPLSEEGKETIAKMRDGDVVLFENIRMYPGEEKNDEKFTKDLASLADVYVNDDFTTSHRAHASIVGLPKLLPSYMGLRFEKEYTALREALSPPADSLAILGGAKPETKLPLVEALAHIMKTVYVGGVSANALFEVRGYTIGKSLSTEKPLPLAKQVSEYPNVVLPIDVRIVDEQSLIHSVMIDRVSSTDSIIDAGPRTISDIRERVAASSFVLWNGPLGDYEKGYDTSTHAVASILAESTAKTIIGGGDTIAAIQELDIMDKFTFVSTAGGAMIDFLAHGTLPGIEALANNQ